MLGDRYQDYMFGLIKNVIDEIGPRPACSEAEKKLGRLLVEEWKPVCDVVSVESFTCSPRAYLGHVRLLVLFYFVGVILYWFYPPASVALSVLVLVLGLFELSGYHEVLDFLFAPERGENVVGVIHPHHQAKQRVIVSAHLDSANEFYLLYRLGSAAVLLMAAAVLGLLLILGGGIARTVAYFTGSADTTVYIVIGIVAIALSPVVSLALFFYTNRFVPGAMDDMAGLAVVTGFSKYLGDAKKKSEEFFPQTTEVVLLATSSEEAGLRGAKRYVKRHLSELKETPTYGLFLDCIYDEKLLTVINHELFTATRHDPRLVQMAQDTAAQHGWPIRAKQLRVGFTDASTFSLKGIPATCLLCADSSRLQLLPNYHNRNDVYEHIHPQSLSVSLQLVIDIIQRIDKSENT
jgi:aminopeptidase YwaD